MTFGSASRIALTRIGDVVSRLRVSPAPQYFTSNRGRWLWNEPHQLQQHTRSFNIKALETVISTAAGAVNQNVQLEKLAEGASNKVYRATIGKRKLIVKIPDPLVPPHWVTASEVATLEFLRSELRLPVPQVFAWSDSDDNPVGCEYILMEEASGEPLHVVWGALKADKKLTVVRELNALLQRLYEASKLFRGYGSVYFASDIARLGISEHLLIKTAQDSKYCIGPLAQEHFVNKVIQASDVHCGPWHHPHEYLISVSQSSKVQTKYKAQQPSEASAIQPFSLPIAAVSDSSETALHSMLDEISLAAPCLVPHTADSCLPLLWHKDLHLGNIFIDDNGQITCIIDWQDVHILPMYLQATIPRFIKVPDDRILLGLPDDFDDMEGPLRTEIWNQFLASGLQQLHLAFLRENMPSFSAMVEDRSLNLLRSEINTFAHVSSHFESSAFLLREILLRVQRNWPAFTRELNHPVPCPMQYTSEEIVKHQQDGWMYNVFQDILRERKVPVADEGWVFADEFEQQKANLDSAIQSMLKILESQQERQDFEQRVKQWNLTR